MKRILSLLITGIVAFSFMPLSSKAQFILKEQWQKKFNASDSLNDIPIAVDDISGAVYVSGRSEIKSPSIHYNIDVIKYDQAGNQIWTRTYNTPLDETANAMCIDGSSNVYVTGYQRDPIVFKLRLVILKYNSAGTLLLHIVYDDPANMIQLGSAIQADNKGNIYVVGSQVSNATHIEDLLLVKFNSAGTLQWKRNYSGVPGSQGSFEFLKIDNKNKFLYVSGFAQNGGINTDILTFKYDFSGNKLWTNFYDGPAHLLDQPEGMALDANGNLYITGKSDGSGSSNDYLTIKYNPAGTLQWAQRYNGTGNDIDIAFSIVVDANSVYITGQSLGAAGGNDYDIVTIKYASSSGALQWTHRFNGALAGWDYGIALTVDKAGYVYVTGVEQQKSANTFPDSWDMITLLLNPAGKQLFKYNYRGSGNGNEAPDAIAIDKNNNVYIAAQIRNARTNYDIVTVKLGKINPFSAGFGSGSSGGASIPGVLAIPSQDAFDFIIDSLNNTSNTDPIVKKLELKNNYTSLQTTLEQREDSLLNTGADLDSTNDPDNYFIVDDDLRGLLNNKNEMIVGNTLYKFINDSITVTITNPDPATVAALRSNNPAVFRQGNVTVTNSNYRISGGYLDHCTEFSFQQTDTSSVVLSTNNGSNTAGVTYSWDYGDGTSDNIPDPGTNFPHTFPSQGTYNVCLTITGGTCDGTVVCHTVNVGSGNCNPVFSITSIEDLNVKFINQSFGAYSSLNWDFGDGTNSTQIEPGSHAYADSGAYTISLTLSGGNCDSIVYSITIHAALPNSSACTNCDKKDHQKLKYYDYATKKKLKIKCWYSNIPLLNYHRVGAKSVNYRKVKSGGINRWRRSGADDEIEATFHGQVMLQDYDANQKLRNCLTPLTIHTTDPNASVTNKSSIVAKAIVRVKHDTGVNFGVCKDALIFNLRVRDGGTDYTKTFTLSDDF